MGAIQLFKNYYESSLSAPDSILIDTFDINEIRQDFIISRDKDGKVLSLYKDNVWNLKTYVSNPSQYGIIDFRCIYRSIRTAMSEFNRTLLQ